jgi:hypothetical protein
VTELLQTRAGAPLPIIVGGTRRRRILRSKNRRPQAAETEAELKAKMM